jgi:hypothetical protein
MWTQIRDPGRQIIVVKTDRYVLVYSLVLVCLRSLRLFDRTGPVAAGTYLSLARLQMSRSRLLPRKAERNTDLGRGREKL